MALAACSKDGGSNADVASATSGKGGSLARFTIVNNYLYVADGYSLKTYNISNPQNTELVNSIVVNNGIETIFAFKNQLFIGSVDGMYIYSIATAAQPAFVGAARHLRSCDPVVANDSTAFVTLLGNQRCGPAEDGLYVYDVKVPTTPLLINKKVMPTPAGIGLSDSILYICQKTNGLGIYNVQNPATPVFRKQLQNYIFEDVIPYNNLLICYVSTGLVLYDISNKTNPVQLSVINN